MSPFSITTDPENTSQYKLVNKSNSNRINDLLLHNTIPVILYDNLLTFQDTGKKFDSEGNHLKMITNANFNVDLATLSDTNMMYDFAK